MSIRERQRDDFYAQKSHTAWAVATSGYISDVCGQWEAAIFQPPQLRNLGNDQSETQIRGVTPHAKYG